MKGYKGKWLKVTGRVLEVYEGSYHGPHVALDVDEVHVSLQFSPEWDKQIFLLRKQQLLSAAGKIDSIENGWISLENCEILPQPEEEHP
jgi:hypothetical protein